MVLIDDDSDSTRLIDGTTHYACSVNYSHNREDAFGARSNHSFSQVTLK